MNYQIVSPSLEGLLSHESIMYAGIRRPVAVLRALDGPAAKGSSLECTGNDRKVLEEYFHDLHNVFMKKIAGFVICDRVAPQESLQIQAMLQEMIKVKRLLTKS